MLGEGLEMGKGDIIKYHQIPYASEGFGKGVVTRKLPCRILLGRLKNLIDNVTDPSYQQESSSAWARDYGVLITLLYTQDINQKFIRHNLGKKRCALIEQIISNVKEQVEKGSLDRKKA